MRWNTTVYIGARDISEMLHQYTEMRMRPSGHFEITCKSTGISAHCSIAWASLSQEPRYITIPTDVGNEMRVFLHDSGKVFSIWDDVDIRRGARGILHTLVDDDWLTCLMQWRTPLPDRDYQPIYCDDKVRWKGLEGYVAPDRTTGRWVVRFPDTWRYLKDVHDECEVTPRYKEYEE